VIQHSESPVAAAAAPDQIKKERMTENLFRDMGMLLPYLDDSAVTDISVVDSGEVIVTRFGKGREFTGKKMPDYVAERIIRAVGAINGHKLDTSAGFPVLQGVIPRYNARITGLVPPNAVRPELQIRRPPAEIYTLEEYVQSGRMTKDQYGTVCSCIEQRGNIIVSGSTGSGKTTLVNAVIKKMEEYTPDECFYIIEDLPELQCRARMKTMLCVPPEDVLRAVRIAGMRWTPDRLIFGEVRTAEVMYALLDAWKTGHDGNVTTIHAKDGKSTLLRIKDMVVKQDAEMAEHLSDVISLVVHLRRTADGIRVDEICPVTDDTDAFIASVAQDIA